MSGVEFEDSSKIGVTFIYNDLLGGVNTLNTNIIKFGDFNKFNVTVILIHNRGHLGIPRIQNNIVENTIRFEYSNYENTYYTLKRLFRLIRSNDIIIANDGFELRMLSKFGLGNNAIFIVPGDYSYYYNIAKNHQVAIDKFVGVSLHITNELKKMLPNRISDIQYIPLGVETIAKKKVFNNSKPLKIIFIGRLEKAKGYFLLPEIDAKLKEKNVLVEWVIVGKPTPDSVNSFKRENVSFSGNVSNEILSLLISESDIFILPSEAEGFPISLIEAMKAGLVPLISDLPSGVPEVVKNGITGYLFDFEDVDEYVEIISKLHFDREHLETLSNNAYLITKDKFTPQDTSKNYINLIKQIYKKPSARKPLVKLYESRLDKKFIPNFIVRIIRSGISLLVKF